MHEESIQEIIEKGIRPLVQFHLGAKEYSLSTIFFASLLAAVIFCLVIVLFGIAAKSKKPARMQYVGELLYMMLRNFIMNIRMKCNSKLFGVNFGIA